MRNLFWVLVLLVGIGLGGVCAWYLVNAESADVSGSSQPDLEQPRLITDPSRADSSHIPAGEIVDQAIEDTTQAQRLPGSPDPVETTIEIIEAPVGAVAEVLGVAGGKDAIAVLPFKMMGGTNSFNKDTGNILCDAFVSEIDSQEYEIFERLQLKSLLEEKGFQASSLVDSPTGAVRFGRLCKVRYIVLGSIASLGGQYHLSGRVVDCATGKVGRRGWVVFSSMTQWASKVPELVNLLALRRGSAGSTGPAYQGNQLVNTVNANANFAVSLSTVQQKQTYLEGEYIKFVVSAEKDCFVTLITVDSAGEMTLLLPNNWQRRAFVRRNTKLTIPSDEMGFRFPIQPPHGETIVKAIATLQPLTLSGVNAKSIDQQKFVTLSRGVKAIGVEGATPTAAANDGSLDELFSSSQWSTAELIVVTAKDKSALVQGPVQITQPVTVRTGGDGDDGGKGVPFDFNHVGDDVNDKILHKYRQLSRGTIDSSTLVLQKPADVPGKSAVDEYLVFAAGSSEFIKIKAADRSKYTESIVVPNLRLRSYGLPTTKLAPVQWALDNRFGTGADLGIADKYDAMKKSRSSLIGLVDGQVDWADPRISHAAWTNPREIAGNGIDDDKNGLVDDVHGWNFTENSPKLCKKPYNFNHGTAIVSVMAGRPTGSETDVIGVLPTARIVTAVVLQDGYTSDFTLTSRLDRVISGIEYVVNSGAKVVNCSFGVSVSPDQLKVLNKMPIWDELERRGIILVCAAGNDNMNIDVRPVFPASLPRANVIAVGATDAAGRPATQYDQTTKKWKKFTNYGKKIKAQAPGTLILAATRRGKTNLLNGTSYAAAMVTAMKASNSN